MQSCSVASCCPSRGSPVCCSLRSQMPLRPSQCAGLPCSRSQLCCSNAATSRVQLCSSSSFSRQCCSPMGAASSGRACRLSCSASVQAQQSSISVTQEAAVTATSAVPTATAAATAAAGAQRVLPLAALSRVLLTGNNSAMFRSALNQRRPVSGPMGLLLLLATVIAASFAAIRSLLVRRGKSCRTCRGFGLQRCRLCLGSGRVDWAAKLNHFDVCPLCMNKRFIVCGECGGHYHRAMFSHRRRQAGGMLEPVASDRPFEGPIVLNLATAGAGAGSAGAILSSMTD